MSWRTTGLLFLLLLVVGGLVYWQRGRVESGSEGTPTALPPSPASGAVLFDDITVRDVVRLDVENSAGSTSFSRRADGAWFMTVPTATMAISQTLTNNVQSLISTTGRRTLSPEENPLRVYGLDEPQATVTLAVRRDENVVRYRLLVGNQTPAGDAYYVLKEGDPRVHLMAGAALNNVLNLSGDPPLPQPTTTPLSSSPPLTGTVPLTATAPVTPTAAP